ncbi:MAG: GNAT family N-acetyltransferase [Candidatus Thorarchaeota archaeon]|nr:GNAT family N-acetyltransferase [Candidatus Thorarchaeota archaeon]
MYYGEKVKLRALEMTDLPMIMEHINHWDTRMFLGNALPISERAEAEWLQRAMTATPWKDGNLYLAIEDKRTGLFIGTTGLHDISPQTRHAELGIFIHNPDNCGKGYGTDAVRVMLWVAFHVLGMEAVMLRHLDINERARKAYLKAGFKPVGVMRRTAFIGGQFHDLAVMDITREEFLELYPPGSFVGSPSCGRTES